MPEKDSLEERDGGVDPPSPSAPLPETGEDQPALVARDATESRPAEEAPIADAVRPPPNEPEPGPERSDADPSPELPEPDPPAASVGEIRPAEPEPDLPPRRPTLEERLIGPREEPSGLEARAAPDPAPPLASEPPRGPPLAELIADERSAPPLGDDLEKLPEDVIAPEPDTRPISELIREIGEAVREAPEPVPVPDPPAAVDEAPEPAPAEAVPDEHSVPPPEVVPPPAWEPAEYRQEAVAEEHSVSPPEVMNPPISEPEAGDRQEITATPEPFYPEPVVELDRVEPTLPTFEHLDREPTREQPVLAPEVDAPTREAPAAATDDRYAEMPYDVDRPARRSLGDIARQWARYGLYALAGYFSLVAALIVLYRFVDPPASTLMAARWIIGSDVTQEWVPLEEISPHLIRAVVVSEDDKFCSHRGIDLAAMREAIERAGGRTPRGASTISMQVVKNLFLWPSKSYVRKAFEIPITLVMELVWPKWRILEIYLNVAEWGPGVFGAESAARYHFKKPAARLGTREAAQLAASLPNPIRRAAGDPGPRTAQKAAVIQARMRLYGGVADCALPAASPRREAQKNPGAKAQGLAPARISKYKPRDAAGRHPATTGDARNGVGTWVETWGRPEVSSP